MPFLINQHRHHSNIIDTSQFYRCQKLSLPELIRKFIHSFPYLLVGQTGYYVSKMYTTYSKLI